jgi:hypothetical protein
MDKETIDQLEGVAALDRRQNDTTNSILAKVELALGLLRKPFPVWKTVLLLAVFWVGCLLAGKAARGSFFFSDNSRIKELEAQLVETTAKAQNEAWLWNSQSLLIATFEDDPTKLDGEPWDFFVTHATLNRMDGFLLIINDGNHPRLAEWYKLLTINKSIIIK